ncbi:MAG: hypothetical protein Unbinned7913contig1002_50 [Prokaryotic dsDNA virus sp.]|jgi:hypothetical protein|nr:MAG: hypothetical protein Unbinned7913contig1002_50 [Prokaryotic dsDNA virus sp.]|tara:strand:+ start:1626 stop:1793 length:168 start_codon:yes stop_codon:yes gene_type:complete
MWFDQYDKLLKNDKKRLKRLAKEVMKEKQKIIKNSLPAEPAKDTTGKQELCCYVA